MHSGGVNKTDPASAAQNDTLNFTPLFGSDELKLEKTPKAVTPFAGMASFFAWLGALGFQKRVAAVMPFEYHSPNAIAPEQTLMAFISAVMVGASQFAQAGWLRHDKAPEEESSKPKTENNFDLNTWADRSSSLVVQHLARVLQMVI